MFSKYLLPLLLLITELQGIYRFIFLSSLMRKLVDGKNACESSCFTFLGGYFKMTNLFIFSHSWTDCENAKKNIEFCMLRLCVRTRLGNPTCDFGSSTRMRAGELTRIGAIARSSQGHALSVHSMKRVGRNLRLLACFMTQNRERGEVICQPRRRLKSKCSPLFPPRHSMYGF